MAKFTLTADKMKIDISKLGIDRFKRVAKIALHDINARLEKEITLGRNAHGGAIKPGGYKTRGVRRTGGRATKNYSSSPVNLYLTGDMRKSKQIRLISDGAELYFNSADSEKKARWLHERGFTGWHELGDQDIKMITERMEKEVDKAFDEAIQVKKNL